MLWQDLLASGPVSCSMSVCLSDHYYNCLACLFILVAIRVGLDTDLSVSNKDIEGLE